MFRLEDYIHCAEIAKVNFLGKLESIGKSVEDIKFIALHTAGPYIWTPRRIFLQSKMTEEDLKQFDRVLKTCFGTVLFTDNNWMRNNEEDEAWVYHRAPTEDEMTQRATYTESRS